MEEENEIKFTLLSFIVFFVMNIYVDVTYHFLFSFHYITQ